MDRGVRLAIDVGTVRIGLAVCDPEAILSSPLPALARSGELLETIRALVELIAERNVVEVYVGDPVALSGLETASTHDARNFALQLATATKVPVRMVDERLTTVSASKKLRLNGKDAKASKSLIDSASAVEILEQSLNIMRQQGTSAGLQVGKNDE